MEHFAHGSLIFDVVDSGPDSGDPVILLHGFPQSAVIWQPIAERLAAHGYRTLAPDQRGYSVRAQPKGRREYRVNKLASDIIALIEQLGGKPVHLVGHDWGAAVAWAVAAMRPDLLRTLTAISVPHPAAYLRGLYTSDQLLRSWYMLPINLPFAPTVFSARDGAILRLFIERFGLSAELARRDVDRMLTTGSMKTAMNWYRALPLAPQSLLKARVKVPTLQIWSDGDTALSGKAAQASGDYVDAPFEFRVMEDTTHWIPEERPDELTALLLEKFRSVD